jgi:hypothetical protein
MATLKPGQYFEYPIDRGIPNGGVWIIERTESGLQRVEKITKMQALALARWHYEPGIYYSRKDGNGNWRDVRVVGDVDAFRGEDNDA